MNRLDTYFKIPETLKEIPTEDKGMWNKDGDKLCLFIIVLFFSISCEVGQGKCLKCVTLQSLHRC